MLRDILLFTIPSVIVVTGMLLVINKMFKQEAARRNFELKKQSRDVILPVRLRAYERIVLFLARSIPESLLMRFDFKNLNVVQLQTMLLQAQRDEFEHNMSQQIYVSKEAWALVVNAKESMNQLINACASRLKSDAPAIELAKLILATYAANKNTPTDVAINYLKNELNRY